MSPSASTAAFVRALLDPRLPPPDGLATWNGSDVSQRFDIHRNNVMASLIDVLRETVPVTRMLVGDRFFDAMSRCFIRERPPASPLMHRYGDALADWIETFEPAAALPYLADVARLEVLRWQALHAADAQPIDPAQVARRLSRPAALAATVFSFHPAMRLLCSRHPAVSLWSAHQQAPAERDAALAGIDLRAAQAALVVRHRDAVLVVPLPVADLALVRSLQAGCALGDAVCRHPDADPTRVLATLLRHETVTGCRSDAAFPSCLDADR